MSSTTHQCPFCKTEFAFYEVRKSERYTWKSCAKCGCKRREKVLRELERQGENLSLFSKNNLLTNQ